MRSAVEGPTGALRTMTPPLPLLQRILLRTSYRVTHKTKLPKGDLVAFLRNIAARGFDPRRIVDIGANRGLWSAKARRVFPAARFLLVGPQAEMGTHLDRFCARSPGAQWLCAGVAAEPGELPFTVTPNSVASSFTCTTAEAREHGWERRLVPVVTLDHLCREVLGAIPEMVKIDAEGYEFEILKGATEVIGNVELFLLELPFFGPRHGALIFSDAVARMAAYGYEAYDFTTFQRRPYDNAIGLCEMAFARRNGQLRCFLGWR